MRYIFLLLMFLPSIAGAAELYSPEPRCALIKNETKKSAFVAIRTDFYTKPDGKRSYYEEVLHTQPGDVRQVCAKGPFLPDYKVYLTVKSFFPLFECKTKLEGEIAIRERPPKPESEARDVYAACVD